MTKLILSRSEDRLFMYTTTIELNKSGLDRMYLPHFVGHMRVKYINDNIFKKYLYVKFKDK